MLQPTTFLSLSAPDSASTAPAVSGPGGGHCDPDQGHCCSPGGYRRQGGAAARKDGANGHLSEGEGGWGIREVLVRAGAGEGHAYPPHPLYQEETELARMLADLEAANAEVSGDEDSDEDSSDSEDEEEGEPEAGGVAAGVTSSSTTGAKQGEVVT